MKKGQNYFSKVGRLQEKSQVLDLLELKRPTLYIFDGQLNRVVYSVNSYKEGEVIARLEEGVPLFERQVVTIHFSLKDTQYFIKGMCEQMKPTSSGLFHFDLSGDLYKLQRRANFRVRVPLEQNFYFNFLEIRGEPVEQQYQLFDLSAGGMALMIPKEKILVMEGNDPCFGELVIAGQPSMELKAQFCYQRSVQAMDGVSKIAGFQFVELSRKTEQHILSLVMEIYRGLFHG